MLIYKNKKDSKCLKCNKPIELIKISYDMVKQAYIIMLECHNQIQFHNFYCFEEKDINKRLKEEGWQLHTWIYDFNKHQIEL